jgi:hypothetical protein
MEKKQLTILTQKPTKKVEKRKKIEIQNEQPNSSGLGEI